MTRHIRSLSQRARLAEFVFSESGAMNAKKAAQMGAVLAASALAGVLMSAEPAAADCGQVCNHHMECPNPQMSCTFQTCLAGCTKICTFSEIDACQP
jgi:hypothetical protein